MLFWNVAGSCEHTRWFMYFYCVHGINVWLAYGSRAYGSRAYGSRAYGSRTTHVSDSSILYITYFLIETSKTPLSPATDSSLTAVLTLRVFPPLRLLHTPELDSLIGLSGGLLPRGVVAAVSCSVRLQTPPPVRRASIFSVSGVWWWWYCCGCGGCWCCPLWAVCGTIPPKPLLFVAGEWGGL